MSSNPIINLAAIEALRAVSPDDGGQFLRELVDIFLADTPPRIAEIETALARRDAPVVLRAAHSIKGSAGNFGAERLARVAGEIEQLAKDNALVGAAERVAALPAVFAETQAELERHCRS